MLGKKRLYFLLPDVASARGTLNALLLARIGIGHMRFWGKDGSLPEDLPDANFWHKTDLTHGAEMGMMAGGILGLLGGIWLVAFPPEWIHVTTFAMLVTTAAGIILGGWMSGMAAAAIPNSRLKHFHERIAAGQILLILDVPYKRVDAIEELIAKHHPEAKFGGIEAHIPVFP